MQVKLMRLRKTNKETQKDVDEILKISEKSYRNKELGKSEFRMAEMFLLATHYEKSIEEIFLLVRGEKEKQGMFRLRMLCLKMRSYHGRQRGF